jgi:hypothetical protein
MLAADGETSRAHSAGRGPAVNLEVLPINAMVGVPRI